MDISRLKEVSNISSNTAPLESGSFSESLYENIQVFPLLEETKKEANKLISNIDKFIPIKKYLDIPKQIINKVLSYLYNPLSFLYLTLGNPRHDTYLKTKSQVLNSYQKGGYNNINPLYLNIYDPDTNYIYPLFSNKGQSILTNYIYYIYQSLNKQ
jgi:hypothetical protein